MELFKLIILSWPVSMQPLEKCLTCGLEYPLDELPDHIDKCEMLSKYYIQKMCECGVCILVFI